MKKNFYPLRQAALLFLLLLYGCNDDVDHYDIPGTLGDRIVLAMEKQGDLSQFVKAIDLIGKREDLERSAYTIFPPTDEGMLKYLNDVHGVSDVSELPEETLRMLVNSHVVRNMMSWDQMKRLNRSGGKKWGEIKGEEGFGSSGNDYHRFKLQTIYSPLPFPTTDPENGTVKKIARQEAYLPIFYFHPDSGILEEDDYNFVFPDSKFTGFNAGDAIALRPDQKSLNGFYHVLDRVLPVAEPLETILAEREEFATFYELLNRFARYSFNSAATNEQLGEVKDSLFTKTYGSHDLDWIAKDIFMSTKYGYYLSMVNNATIPNSEVLTNYLESEFVTPGFYGSISDIPDDAIKVLLKNHCLSVRDRTNHWLRPSELGLFVGGNLELLSLEKSNVLSTDFCNNAVIYEINTVLAPRLFKSVTKPLVFDPKYSFMLKIVNRVEAVTKNQVVARVMDPEIMSTAFIPSDETMRKHGFEYDEEKEKFSYTDPFLGETRTMSDSDLRDFVELHLVSGKDVQDLQTRYFARTLSPGRYLAIKDGNLIAGGNYELNDTKPVQILGKDERGYNGTFYEIDDVLWRPKRTISDLLANEDIDEYKEFRKLLENAGLLKKGFVSLLAGQEEMTVLVPTNEAIEANRDKIPQDLEKLRSFLAYFFVQNKAVYSDGDFSGRLDTKQEIKRKVYRKINVTNAPGDLRFTDLSGNEARVIEDERFSNLLLSEGTIQLIDNILVGE
ncbi:hypothetical protein FUAX_30100 [Fulvitalea axinellae]|uniref:FAS1 domain-containing protein n=1 Tax=Fulvitalea axinellae TaxID=1182444 RepID=A0AAU9CR56_9BACT|nr:hypothetical protein FUAX_30100 [Fulvitalea axinellae]